MTKPKKRLVKLLIRDQHGRLWSGIQARNRLTCWGTLKKPVWVEAGDMDLPMRCCTLAVLHAYKTPAQAKCHDRFHAAYGSRYWIALSFNNVLKAIPIAVWIEYDETGYIEGISKVGVRRARVIGVCKELVHDRKLPTCWRVKKPSKKRVRKINNA